MIRLHCPHSPNNVINRLFTIFFLLFYKFFFFGVNTPLKKLYLKIYISLMSSIRRSKLVRQEDKYDKSEKMKLSFLFRVVDYEVCAHLAITK